MEKLAKYSSRNSSIAARIFFMIIASFWRMFVWVCAFASCVGLPDGGDGKAGEIELQELFDSGENLLHDVCLLFR
ncbi:MAG: hypothetical protein LUG44_04700 [Clostridiales bacterium]|nr:hypothetical protein [Clostridiales bacterium]